MALTMAVTSTNMPQMSVIPLILFALIVTLGYATLCWLKPFTHCHRCHGRGVSPHRLADRIRYNHRPHPKAARGLPACPHCKGTGLRLRTGRRTHNHLRRLHRDTR